MTLFGKIEGVTKIKSSAEKFHTVWGGRPHHVSNITPEHVQGCDLHDGDYGTAGSTISWRYIHDGKEKVDKQIVEEINDEENSTRFKMISGDLMEGFKTLTVTVKATDKEDGTYVTWILEYEKLNENVADPTSYLDYFALLTKNADDHLQEQA